MRRLLRDKKHHETGDTSTLLDPTVTTRSGPPVGSRHDQLGQPPARATVRDEIPRPVLIFDDVGRSALIDITTAGCAAGCGDATRQIVAECTVGHPDPANCRRSPAFQVARSAADLHRTLPIW